MTLKITAGFCPFSDGSGPAVTVEAGYEFDGAEPSMSINTVYQFNVSDWPMVRDGIDRLLKAFPDGSVP